MIPFNKPAAVGNEFKYMQQALANGKLSGNGQFTNQCQNFFEKKYQFKKTLLTSSGTDALEMAAILCNISDGDEVIIPSFAFPSCANAFILRGAKIKFADSEVHRPHISAESIQKNISSKTKAVLLIHYAGEPCSMNDILPIIQTHNLFLIEDCAHAFDSYYQNKPLGSFGALAAFSFHETKNIQCGEGGMLVINDAAMFERADIIWEKGTNRAAMAKGLVSKYHWVDIGSSFLMSELQAAFLFAQLENSELIQKKRKYSFSLYAHVLSGHDLIPFIKFYPSQNANACYLTCKDKKTRDTLMQFLKEKEIMSVFHYLPLHLSPFSQQHFENCNCPNSENYSDTLLRLPLFFELDEISIQKICTSIKLFFQSEN